MKVTRAVIGDLLPIYWSGEASADTRALVEEYLADDPEFAQTVQRERSQQMFDPVTVQLPPDHEKQTLAQTKRMLARRTNFLTYAVMFTAAIFATTLDSQYGIRLELTFGLAISVVLALVCWIGYFVTNHRLRVTAL